MLLVTTGSTKSFNVFSPYHNTLTLAKKQNILFDYTYFCKVVLPDNNAFSVLAAYLNLSLEFLTTSGHFLMSFSLYIKTTYIFDYLLFNMYIEY